MVDTKKTTVYQSVRNYTIFVVTPMIRFHSYYRISYYDKVLFSNLLSLKFKVNDKFKAKVEVNVKIEVKVEVKVKVKSDLNSNESF